MAKISELPWLNGQNWYILTIDHGVNSRLSWSWSTFLTIDHGVNSRVSWSWSVDELEIYVITFVIEGMARNITKQLKTCNILLRENMLKLLSQADCLLANCGFFKYLRIKD